MDEGFVEVEAGRLFYQRAGAGPPVVLVHGGMWDRRMWDDQFDAFAQAFTVVRYDMRGYGRSDSPISPYTNHDDLETLIDRLELGTVAIVGLSFGGAVTLDYAAGHPDRVAALVLASCGVGGHSEWSDEVVEAWRREDVAIAAGDLRGALEGQLRFWTPGGEDLDTDTRLRDVAFENLGIYEIEDGLAARADPPVIERLDEIEAPTLVVVGARDVPDIDRMADRLVDEMPAAEKVVIPGADHLPNVRAPETFNRLVIEFLRKAVPQP